MPTIESPFLSREDAAAYLNIGLTTLRRLTYERKKIPYIPVSGRKILYEKADLDAYIESVKKRPVDPAILNNPYGTYRKRRGVKP